ncbi:hypothetical protein V1525DRAFT_58979 [Lipomyces kononenkoae]|uniref:Uncharacterized protein n=1 Tax=Lipomyces kononenkoae TaxID=34357 RepID=A0ACC3SS35_LIPKO
MTTSGDRKELKAEWKNEVEVATIALQEVAKHKTKNDNWIVIHGKVYDVTNYGKDHPGGLDILFEVAGTDATSAYEDVGHSEDAAEVMHRYLVGVIERGSLEAGEARKTGSQQLTRVVVRQNELEQSGPQTKRLLNLRTELAAFAVGTAGLTYFINSFHLLPSLSVSGFHATGWHAAFTQGFFTASAALGIAGLAGLRYVSNATKTKSFSAYPAHLQSATAAGAIFQPVGVLNASVYRKFTLQRKDELSDGIYRFVFDLPTKYSVLGLPIGQHVAIRAVIDDHTVVRSYTPVSNNRDLGRLELLIRVYPKGLMGNYLKNLKVGETADIRGPKGAMKYRRGTCKEIGMIGGGTGITPLYQLIRAICEDPKDNTKISVIYGNRSESDIMLRGKLDHYARVAPHKFKIYYTLDQPGQEWTGGRGHVTKDLIQAKLPQVSPDAKILLCGPPGMVNAMKNTLVELGFEAPGGVSKMSDQIFCF